MSYEDGYEIKSGIGFYLCEILTIMAIAFTLGLIGYGAFELVMNIL